jgi:hypothetical protein
MVEGGTSSSLALGWLRLRLLPHSGEFASVLASVRVLGFKGRETLWDPTPSGSLGVKAVANGSAVPVWPGVDGGVLVAKRLSA